MHYYCLFVLGMNSCRSCSLAVSSRFLAGSPMRSAGQDLQFAVSGHEGAASHRIPGLIAFNEMVRGCYRILKNFLQMVQIAF